MRYLFFIAAFLLIFSCNQNCAEYNPETCGTKNPIQDIAWLNSLAKDIENNPDFYLTQALFEGNIIFILKNCCAACNTTIPVYNCTGDIICNNLGECPEISSGISNEKTILQNESSACDL